MALEFYWLNTVVRVAPLWVFCFNWMLEKIISREWECLRSLAGKKLYKFLHIPLQFFLENSKLDEDELAEEKPEVDLEEAANKVHDSLNTAEDLAKRLSDLNQDIIEWLVNYANNKASNKWVVLKVLHFRNKFMFYSVKITFR